MKRKTTPKLSNYLLVFQFRMYMYIYNNSHNCLAYENISSRFNSLFSLGCIMDMFACLLHPPYHHNARAEVDVYVWMLQSGKVAYIRRPRRWAGRDFRARHHRWVIQLHYNESLCGYLCLKCVSMSLWRQKRA